MSADVPPLSSSPRGHRSSFSPSPPLLLLSPASSVSPLLCQMFPGESPPPQDPVVDPQTRASLTGPRGLFHTHLHEQNNGVDQRSFSHRLHHHHHHHDHFIPALTGQTPHCHDQPITRQLHGHHHTGFYRPAHAHAHAHTHLPDRPDAPHTHLCDSHAQYEQYAQFLSHFDMPAAHARPYGSHARAYDSRTRPGTCALPVVPPYIASLYDTPTYDPPEVTEQGWHRHLPATKDFTHSLPHTHMGDSVPHTHMDDSVPHTHMGDSVAHTHMDDSVPHTHMEDSVPHTHMGDSVPHTHMEDSVPHTHMGDSVPHAHMGDSLPHTHMEDSVPHTHMGDSVPHTHMEDSVPHTHMEDSVPHTHMGDSVAHTHMEDSVPHTHMGDSVAHTHMEDSVPHTHMGDSVAHTHMEDSVPHTHMGDSSCHGPWDLQQGQYPPLYPQASVQPYLQQGPVEEVLSPQTRCSSVGFQSPAGSLSRQSSMEASPAWSSPHYDPSNYGYQGYCTSGLHPAQPVYPPPSIQQYPPPSIQQYPPPSIQQYPPPSIQPYPPPSIQQYPPPSIQPYPPPSIQPYPPPYCTSDSMGEPPFQSDCTPTNYPTTPTNYPTTPSSYPPTPSSYPPSPTPTQDHAVGSMTDTQDLWSWKDTPSLHQFVSETLRLNPDMYPDPRKPRRAPDTSQYPRSTPDPRPRPRPACPTRPAAPAGPNPTQSTAYRYLTDAPEQPCVSPGPQTPAPAPAQGPGWGAQRRRGRGGGRRRGGGGGGARSDSHHLLSDPPSHSQGEEPQCPQTNHTSNSSLLCPVCQRDFRSLQSLNGHLRSHGGLRGVTRTHRENAVGLSLQGGHMTRPLLPPISMVMPESDPSPPSSPPQSHCPPGGGVSAGGGVVSVRTGGVSAGGGVLKVGGVSAGLGGVSKGRGGVSVPGGGVLAGRGGASKRGGVSAGRGGVSTGGGVTQVGGVSVGRGVSTGGGVSKRGGASVGRGVSKGRGVSAGGGATAGRGVSKEGGVSLGGVVSVGRGASKRGGVSAGRGGVSKGRVSAQALVPRGGGVSAGRGLSTGGGVTKVGGVSVGRGASASVGRGVSKGGGVSVGGGASVGRGVSKGGGVSAVEGVRTVGWTRGVKRRGHPSQRGVVLFTSLTRLATVPPDHGTVAGGGGDAAARQKNGSGAAVAAGNGSDAFGRGVGAGGGDCDDGTAAAGGHRVERYTPSPMLCPVREGPGLYCSLLAPRGQQGAHAVDPDNTPSILDDLLATVTEDSRKQKIIKPRINIGAWFQADIPPLKDRRHAPSNPHNAQLLWSPWEELEGPVTQQRVEALRMMSQSTVMPGGGASSEHALHVLSEHRGDFLLTLDELLQPGSSKHPPSPLIPYHYTGSVRWTSTEKRQATRSFRLHRKDFSRMQTMVRTKSLAQCVEYYYLWKKKRHGARTLIRLSMSLPDRKDDVISGEAVPGESDSRVNQQATSAAACQSVDLAQPAANHMTAHIDKVFNGKDPGQLANPIKEEPGQ